MNFTNIGYLLPTRFNPSSTLIFAIDIYENSAVYQGRMQIDNTGYIQIVSDINFSTFTANTGENGWKGFSISYSVI